MTKLTPEAFDLKATQIKEQWEARRKEIWEPVTAKHKALCQTADHWQMDQMSNLYRASGWTAKEIGAWLLQQQAKQSRN
jgi:hypothetical protein